MQSITRNKSNDHFESLQYRQHLFAITHLPQEKILPYSYNTRCSENHTLFEI